MKGDLFATTFSFGAQAVIKLGSSLILTRILAPEAYGIVMVLMSIVFVVEMLADLGITVFIVRDKRAEEPRYLHTAWTVRFARAVLNTSIVFLGAPLIAALYGTPTLVNPLRVFAFWFLISALESMSFPLAVRHKKARLLVYSELVAGLTGNIFSVIYCHYSRDYWGMVYGTLINRILMTLLSHRFYREYRPRLMYDRAAAREMLALTKYIMPSSLLTLALTQFDKVIFLRLFDLHRLGVYGLANNIAGPIESLIGKISQTVLYPRCAHNYRADPNTSSAKYYTENVRLFIAILILPAIIGGAADLIITVLYPSRYAESAAVLRAFMMRATLLSLASTAENMLLAAGQTQVTLVGNALRAAWMITASLIGYRLFGFMGFTYGFALSGLPPWLYCLWLQNRERMLVVRYELYKLAFVGVIALGACLGSKLLLMLWPALAHIRA